MHHASLSYTPSGSPSRDCGESDIIRSRGKGAKSITGLLVLDTPAQVDRCVTWSTTLEEERDRTVGESVPFVRGTGD